jgi:outer membrane protein TolC
MLKKFCAALLFVPIGCVFAQTPTSPKTPGDSLVLDLSACLRYAVKHQPALRSSLVNQQIYDYQVKGALSDWFPQVIGTGEVEHYFQDPLSFVPNSVFTPGATGYKEFPANPSNISALGVGLTQNIYNRDVMLAAKTGKYYRKYAQQSVDSAKIDMVVDVSKAYWDVFTSEQQLGILLEDVKRLERSVKDTYNQYQSGVVDKTDYKQATILLNNARVQFKQAQESIPAKYAYLKQLMGFPVDSSLSLHSDSASMVAEAMIDTSLQLDYNRRIEIQSLETQRQLRLASVDYQRLGWLPSVSFLADYILDYGTNTFSQLYNQAYPESYLGLTLNIPIFQGFKRIYALKAAKLSVTLIDLRLEDTRRVINTQYAGALAAYRSDLENWNVSQENITLSKEVYNTVTLQYKEGIKTYLDVITAETDLRTSEINGLNALFALLSDKMDLLKSVGMVNTNIN